MKRWLIVVLALVSGVSGAAEPLRFLYEPGDQFRYVGTSTQRILVNGTFLQDNLLGYRIAFSVAGVDPSGTGRLVGHISYLTQPQGAPGAVTEEYDVDYLVDARGRYQVPPGQVMPVVRSVPTFPDTDLKPGDTWTGKGEEVHDMNASFGISELLRIPFDVFYTYEGTTERNGAVLHVIRSEYTLYKRTGYRYPRIPRYPVLMTGHSSQRHYFNAEKGREEGYEEDYSLVLTLNTGEMQEFAGRGESSLVEAQVMDKPAVAAEVQRELEDRGMAGVEVRAVPRGVVLNLDNIRFPGDSAELVDSELEKLRLIGEVLRQFPDRDILVEGHTAVARSTVDPQTLSEARAAAVAQALADLGVRNPGQIVSRGWGASRPVAPNTTEAGRAKNRRVEITLLEN